MFRALRQRLLFIYLAAIVVTLGTFTGAIYLVFSQSLYRQMDNELLTLAKAAAPSLAIAKGEIIDRTLDRDVSWHNLLRSDQSVEWFSIGSRRLATVGTSFPTLDLMSSLMQFQQQGQIRIVTVPVYRTGAKVKELEGYVRTSTSIASVEQTLSQLRWGIGLGLLLALTLTGIGGLYLTRLAMQPIERSFWQLKQFTADASHELRSPLTVIRTSIEDILLTCLELVEQPVGRKLHRMADATTRMTRLVEDLLLLTRMDGAIDPLPQYSIPLDELLQDALDLLEPQFQAKAMTVKCSLISSLEITGDATQLLRMFANLLENALRYTATGERITLTMQRLDSSVLVTISDTGIGIAPEDLPRVFERFWRTDRARSHTVSGVGLGLAIAQSIARQHGGEISVKSQIGLGSQFQVRLPIGKRTLLGT